MLTRFYQGYIALLFALLLPASYAAAYQNGVNYIRLDKTVDSAPAVVEFFSFYCKPCYLFTNSYHVSKTVSEALPAGTRLCKYHVSLMGTLGHELTEAWSVAMLLGIEEKIERKLFEKIQITQGINSIEDIKSLFAEEGVDAATYDNTRQSLPVKVLVAKQNEAVKEMDVHGTPSFYVSGKYKIENSAIADKSIAGYAKEFAAAIRDLLDNQP